jgi:hypothetical protein
MPETAQQSIRTTAGIAFRSYDQLSERDREAVLVTLIEVGDAREAEAAGQTLHHLREQRRRQLELKGLLFGIGDEHQGGAR